MRKLLLVVALCSLVTPLFAVGQGAVVVSGGYRMSDIQQNENGSWLTHKSQDVDVTLRGFNYFDRSGIGYAVSYRSENMTHAVSLTYQYRQDFTDTLMLEVSLGPEYAYRKEDGLSIISLDATVGVVYAPFGNFGFCAGCDVDVPCFSFLDGKSKGISGIVFTPYAGCAYSY